MIQIASSPTDVPMPPSGMILTDMIMMLVVLALFGMGMMAVATYSLEDMYWYVQKRVASAAQRIRMYRR